MADELIPIRLSHLLSHSGVGAIVRGPEGLIVIKDIRHWTDNRRQPAGRPIPYVERVRAALGISQELHEPPAAKALDGGRVDGSCVPAMRFPGWMRCPGCGALYFRPWRKESATAELRCPNRDKHSQTFPVLEQLPWVLVDPRGYLADVPWHYLAHQEARSAARQNCKVSDQLYLIEKGYDERLIRCEACGATAKFRGNERIPFGQKAMQPWSRHEAAETAEDPAEDEENQVAQVLPVNDTRVYSPKTRPALIIPPESRVRKGTVVDRLYRNSADREALDRATTPLKQRIEMQRLAGSYRCSVDDIRAALADLREGYPLYGQTLTPGQLKESEYHAFLEELPDQRDDEDLVTQNNSSAWHALAREQDIPPAARKIISSIENLVRIDRLKEVKVFEGFTRLGKPEPVIPPDLVGESNWLPAIELYGEGIFLTLEEKALSAWEKNPAVIKRLGQLEPRFVRSGRDEPNPLSARFMLLHTLSHLLMRQIEFEGGYPAASLSERLYCADQPVPMAGILIYVAVPDVAGSLGGLAELGTPHRFLGILSQALAHAEWCSFDPVCSEHEGQGPGLLNRAACHACALVPEPACSHGNTLLDRIFVKGDMREELPSFFDASDP